MPSTPGDARAWNPSRAYVRYAVAIVFLVSVFNIVDRLVVSMVGQQIAKDLALSDTQLGLLLGPSFAVVHFLAILPMAWLADRTARRTVIAAGLLVWSAMTALGGIATSFVQLFIARMGVGIGEAAGSPPSISLLTDTAPESLRARAISALTIGSLVGMGAGLIVGGYLASAYGWRTTLIAVGLPGILVAALVRYTLREPPRARSAGDAATPLAAARHLFALPSYRWMVAAVCLAGIPSVGRNLWEPIFLARVYRFEPARIGITIFLLGSLPAAFGAYAGGLLADRLAPVDTRWPLRVCAVGNLVATPLLACFALWPEGALLFGTLPVAFVFLSLGSFFIGFYSPPTGSVAQALAKPNMRALSHAIWTMFLTLVGQGIGAALIGWLNQALTASYGEVSIRYSLASVTLLAALSGLLYLRAASFFPGDLARAAREPGPSS
jgi:predicted MFS family arabinose efflux permease